MPNVRIGTASPSVVRENARPWREILIADLIDREAALFAQWRLERAMLLDHIDRLARELEMVNPDRSTHERHRREQTPDAYRRRQEVEA